MAPVRFVPVVFFLITFLSITTFGQFKVGPKFSTYLSNIKDHKFILNNKFQLTDQSLRDSNSDLNYGYGIFVRYDFGKVYLQADVMQTSYSARISVYPGDSYFNDDVISGNGGITIKMKRIEVPVNVGVKLGVLRLQAGVVPAYLTQAKVKYGFNNVQNSDTGQSYYAAGEEDEKAYYNKLQLDGQASIGLTLFKRVFFDVKYQTNLSNLRQSIDVLGTKLNSKEKMSVIGLSLSFNVLK